MGENLPDKSKIVDAPWVLDNPLEIIASIDINDKDQTSDVEELGANYLRKNAVKNVIPILRKSVIPKNCSIRITNPKANKIYDELKHIDVKVFVNCSAVALRVFLELSVDTFLEKKGLLKDGEISASESSRSLYQKVNDASQYLHQKKLADDAISQSVRLLTKERNSLLGVETMHAYVHSNKMSPISSDIQTAWDNIQEFMVILWSQIEIE